ncbi:cytochrome b [Shewanella sp. WXL01]|uniref:cytochrome b n=1 Tax=Shewanella sp. WXL01 TaxID=2709721 RepID=UPI00143867C1|nr:cytochrome b [Shewanella sp. WXL01]NKF50028.1 cytochrome b [Shewanella sp. WXL01]
MFKNTNQGYGWVAIGLHWISAITVIGLFAVGFWMVELTYYSKWYQVAPHWHKSIGLMLLLATVIRIAWKQLNPKVSKAAEHKAWEQKAASIAHGLIYMLLFTIMVSGILISTADGRGILVFDWFELPSPGLLFGKEQLFENQADIAGLIHQYAAYSLIALVVVHGAGAIKHHFVDKDNTLKRMLRPE